MPKLPRITGEEAIKAFERIGFVEHHCTGSHHVLKREGHPFVLSIPAHKHKTLGPGLLNKLIRAAGITADQFRDAIS